MDNINQTFEKIHTLFEQLIKQNKDYLNIKKEEKLIDNQTIEESELLLQGENILDRKYEQKQRINKLLQLNNDLQQELNEINNWLNQEHKHINKSINETIVTMKEIRERKTKKDIKRNPKRKKIIETECKYENEEIDKMWSDSSSDNDSSKYTRRHVDHKERRSRSHSRDRWRKRESRSRSHSRDKHAKVIINIGSGITININTNSKKRGNR